MNPYNLRQTKTFEKEFTDLEEDTKKKIDKIIWNEIRINPENFPLMRYEYAGYREVKIGKQLRLLFAICNECRELRTQKKLKLCLDCNENDKNSIKLLTTFYHKKKYPKPKKFMK